MKLLAGWRVPSALERPSSSLLQVEIGGETAGVAWLGECSNGRAPFPSQTFQNSPDTKLGVWPSQNFLQEDDPDNLAPQQQVTSSRSSQVLISLDLSPEPRVALEYLPYFRTSEHLLGCEPEQEPEAPGGLGGEQDGREAWLPDASLPPDGFFPYYHSEEESLPSLTLQASNQDPPLKKEAPAGYFYRMACNCGSSALSADSGLGASFSGSITCCPILLVPAGHSHDRSLDAPFSSDATLTDQVVWASGSTPHHRAAEERLHSSPGPSTSLSRVYGPVSRETAQAWKSHAGRETQQVVTGASRDWVSSMPYQQGVKIDAPEPSRDFHNPNPASTRDLNSQVYIPTAPRLKASRGSRSPPLGGLSPPPSLH